MTGGSWDDLLFVLAGVGCLSMAGFQVSLARGLAVTGVCLIGVPIVFSWLLPMAHRMVSK